MTNTTITNSVDVYITEMVLEQTRCSSIAERPRCRVHYSFRQK